MHLNFSTIISANSFRISNEKIVLEQDPTTAALTFDRQNSLVKFCMIQLTEAFLNRQTVSAKFGSSKNGDRAAAIRLPRCQIEIFRFVVFERFDVVEVFEQKVSFALDRMCADFLNFPLTFEVWMIVAWRLHWSKVAKGDQNIL